MVAAMTLMSPVLAVTGAQIELQTRARKHMQRHGQSRSWRQGHGATVPSMPQDGGGSDRRNVAETRATATSGSSGVHGFVSALGMSSICRSAAISASCSAILRSTASNRFRYILEPLVIRSVGCEQAAVRATGLRRVWPARTRVQFLSDITPPSIRRGPRLLRENVLVRNMVDSNSLEVLSATSSSQPHHPTTSPHPQAALGGEDEVLTDDTPRTVRAPRTNGAGSATPSATEGPTAQRAVGARRSWRSTSRASPGARGGRGVCVSSPMSRASDRGADRHRPGLPLHQPRGAV